MSSTSDAPNLADSVALTIRELLLQAHHSLSRDLSIAERCIAGAVHLLPEMGSATSRADPAPQMAPGGLAPWQILRVRAVIEARLSESLSAEDLASAVRLSKSWFARAFKRSFGVAPHAYINRRRIVRSKALMLQTGEPLSAIALACGLADQAHLCRLFRSFEGQSPSGWRRSQTGDGDEMALVA